MEGTSQIDELDFDSWAQVSDKSEEESKHNESRFGFTDDDIEYETSEQIQAHSYERTFVVQGPVVKVYKRGDDSVNYDMSFPVLKNENDESIINPSSLILHNGESQMIFTDKNDSSQIFNFDLEAGKIVEQYQADKSANTS